MLDNYLDEIDKIIRDGFFDDSWASLSSYETPKWYKGAKFGLFSHYGLYSVPAYMSEWYSRNMYIDGSKTNLYHRNVYGELDKFGYKDFIGDFSCEKFDAKKWLEIVKNSGAKYYIPVAEHHDGFMMYESKVSEFSSKIMGPKINIIKELEVASREVGIEFGVSSHRAEHFFFMSEGRKCLSDINNPQYGDMYWPSVDEEMFGKDESLTKLFLQDWLVRCCELVDLFKPRVIYFDWWIEMPEFMPYLRKFMAYFYNKSFDYYKDYGVINYKHDAIAYQLAVRDVERGQFSNVQNDYWQCCTSIASNSWSYTKDNNVKSWVEIVHVLIDVVSKNGNLLLNFCPHKDGFIVKEEVAVLGKIGSWLVLNGEGIYDTHPWKVYGEGDTNATAGDFMESNSLVYRQNDFRFTQKANCIYLFIMQPSSQCSFRVMEFGQRKRNLKWHNDLLNVDVLSSDNKVSIIRNEDFMQLDFENNLADVPVCVRFEFK